ncbi:hypothetical protein Pla123a_25720 [Posidoniimonas polymericola]|uniref:Uncharacterized protein n=1 Tax=Posidoniimonas polymericola TaxID=2528002 RepID=A0A5C5YQD6_9BACT|nr:hypothetical protein [Posidoniimonas polymericola]TWT77141.1 hypothetical protein Pla123a_25720 [Posidoniimonas polymericola]
MFGYQPLRVGAGVVLLVLVGLIVSDAASQPIGRGRGGGGFGRGQDEAFNHDRNVFHELLGQHGDIERTVTKTPNGVRTQTTSADPELVAKIRDHVAAMKKRIEGGSPVRRWDPLFNEVFANADKVQMQIKEIPDGVEVVESSADPKVVALIQAHAKVVSGFVDSGFEEAEQAHQVPDYKQAAAVRLEPTAKAKLIAVSAALDQLYIPALALTNQGKQKQGVAAIGRLQKRLPKLVERAESVGVAGVLFGGVSKIVEDALGLAESGETLAAHESLEPIRALLAERRRSLGVAYPLDVLSDYHRVMEEIVKPAKDKPAADVDQAYLAELRQLAAEASHTWALAEQTSFELPAAPEGWPSPLQIGEGVDKVRASLSKLNAALRGGDPDAILQAAVGLKPPFAKLYMSFGAFPGKGPGAAAAQ